MSDDTLDEARKRFLAQVASIERALDRNGASRCLVDLETKQLIALAVDYAHAERANAERAALSSLTVRAEIGRAVEQATRPYRMAILKRHEAGECNCPTDRREDACCSLLADTDIEEARAALRAKEDR